MKNQILRIPFIYVLFTAVYYPSALLADRLNDREGDHFLTRFYNELDGIFFWVNAHIIYLFTLMGSSLIGMIWYYRKQHSQFSSGFAGVFLFSSAAFLVLMIIAAFR